MTFLDVLQLLSGPLIGAVIGLLTNYIAVKMLFRPHRALYIGKLHVPFTPGIIPRRQEALGEALGHTVSKMLVRKEDLKKVLLSDGVSGTIAKGILALPSIRTSGEALLGEGYEGRRDLVVDALTDRILNGILAMNIGEVIANEASAAVSGFASRNPLIGMFVNDSTIASLAAPIGEKVTVYLQGDGRTKLREALSAELEKYEDKPVAELVRNTESFEAILTALYRKLVESHADAIVAHFKISKIVKEKIKAMPPRDLEELVLSVMKKELNAVVCLGGVIGLVMGFLDILIATIG
jgi:uncharacterized membrane protein YheB (UPF0754 family)